MVRRSGKSPRQELKEAYQYLLNYSTVKEATDHMEDLAKELKTNNKSIGALIENARRSPNIVDGLHDEGYTDNQIPAWMGAKVPPKKTRGTGEDQKKAQKATEKPLETTKNREEPDRTTTIPRVEPESSKEALQGKMRSEVQQHSGMAGSGMNWMDVVGSG